VKAVQKILALDPATNCGWATSPSLSGTWDLSVRRDESTNMRLVRLRSKLSDIYASDPFDLLVYEAARNASPGMQNALVIQATLQGVIQLWVADHPGVEMRGYSPSEIKKYATGKGNVGKESMIAAATARWPGIEWVDDNQVDAVFIWQMAMDEYAGK
jgi:Holliday junction resolvasome RuvABC endonuclease subunit